MNDLILEDGTVVKAEALSDFKVFVDLTLEDSGELPVTYRVRSRGGYTKYYSPSMTREMLIKCGYNPK